MKGQQTVQPVEKHSVDIWWSKLRILGELEQQIWDNFIAILHAFFRKSVEFIFQVAEMSEKWWGLYWNLVLHSSVWALK